MNYTGKEIKNSYDTVANANVGDFFMRNGQKVKLGVGDINDSRAKLGLEPRADDWTGWDEATTSPENKTNEPASKPVSKPTSKPANEPAKISADAQKPSLPSLTERKKESLESLKKRDWVADRNAYASEWDAEIQKVEKEKKDLEEKMKKDPHYVDRKTRKAYKDSVTPQLNALEASIKDLRNKKKNALVEFDAWQKEVFPSSQAGGNLVDNSYAVATQIKNKKDYDALTDEEKEKKAKLEGLPDTSQIKEVVEKSDPELVEAIETNQEQAKAGADAQLKGEDPITAMLQSRVKNEKDESIKALLNKALASYDDYWGSKDSTADDIVHALSLVSNNRKEVEAWLQNNFYKGDNASKFSEDNVQNALDKYFPSGAPKNKNSLGGTSRNVGADKTALQRILDTEDEVINRNTEDRANIDKILESYNTDAEKFIDPKFIENMPTFIWQAAREGAFGNRKIDEKLEKDYKDLEKKLKSGELDEASLSPEQKKTIAQYNRALEEKHKANNRYGYAIVNHLGAVLDAMGSALTGTQPSVESDWSKMKNSKLAGGMERYNKKYADIANKDVELLGSDASNTQQIQQTLEKLYTDSRVKPYVTMLNAENKKILVDYIAKMGANIDWKQLPGLFMGLMLYQDTGKVTDVVLDAAKTVGTIGSNIIGGLL